MVKLDSHISLQIEVQSGISRSTAQRMLRLHNFHPYHIALTQAMLYQDPEFFRYVIFFDEATFHNTGQLTDITVTIGLTMLICKHDNVCGFSKMGHLLIGAESFNDFCIVDGEELAMLSPRSPDLTSLDFFLWGFLKNMVYADASTTSENMVRITDACRNIPRHVLLSTVQNFERRIQLCINNNEGIFENLIR
ncbi:hypothetical protein ACFW04_014235 [Cataglyphis niger]